MAAVAAKLFSKVSFNLDLLWVEIRVLAAGFLSFGLDLLLMNLRVLDADFLSFHG